MAQNQRHLLGLINDVLNLARIETGRVEYTLEDVPLAPILAEVPTMVEPLVVRGGLTDQTVARDSADPLIMVRADRDQVRQILLNLITNAIKFTPAGGSIAVDVDSPASASELVCVHVRDTGIRIPAAQLERIFEPFVHLGSRLSGQHEGVGLGLAISRDLARGMGGDLTVASTVGVGTTFTLTLPRA